MVDPVRNSSEALNAEQRGIISNGVEEKRICQSCGVEITEKNAPPPELSDFPSCRSCYQNLAELLTLVRNYQIPGFAPKKSKSGK